jgi:putative transposase
LIERNHKLSVKRQCELLSLTRSTLYYKPASVAPADLEMMRMIDEQYLKTPFYGTVRMTAHLRRQGHLVNKKRVKRLMRLMGLIAIYQKPRTSIATPEHIKYPYLLGGVDINRSGQVWATDITYIPMARGFLYLIAIMDLHSRFIVSWRLSNSLDDSFCVEALQEALVYGSPEIFNSDQGSQFTGEGFTSLLKHARIAISMDGKGRCMDNIFVERLWRSLKYEEVYLHAYDSVEEARKGIAAWIQFYNYDRPHQSLSYQTPWEVFKGPQIPFDNFSEGPFCPLSKAS